MANIALKTYINDCVRNFAIAKESDVIAYIEQIKALDDYKSLRKRIVWGVGKSLYPTWKHLSQSDYDKANDDKIYSLYCAAFKIAYPTAWKMLED